MVGYYPIATTADTVWTAWTAMASTTSCTSDEVWGTWVNSSCATTTTAGVWQVWTSNGAVNVRVDGRYQEPVRTPEEQAKLDEAMRLRAAAEAEAAEKDRLAKESADKRAEELLLAHLDAEQKQQYAKEKKFKVKGGDGASFELEYKWAGNIREFAKDSKPVARLCIHPRERVPIPDSLLAQKLMIETDVDQFRQIANRTALATT